MAMKKKIIIIFSSLVFVYLAKILVYQRFNNDNLSATKKENPNKTKKTDENLEKTVKTKILKKFKNINITNGLASDEVRDVFVDSNNFLYAATSKGLSVSNDRGKSFKTFNKESGLISDLASSVVVNGLGHIFVGTHNGLSISTDSGLSFRHFQSDNVVSSDQKKNTLANNDINRMFLHQNGDLYIATARGLSILRESHKKIESFYKSDGLPDDQVTDVFVDAAENIYIATWNGVAVSKDKGRSFRTYNEKDGLLNRFVRGIFVSNGKVYCATTLGLSILDLNQDPIRVENITKERYGLAEEYVTKVYKYDGVLYLLTLGGGLAVSDDDGKTFKKYGPKYNDGLESGRLYSLHYVNPKKYYLATWKGIFIKLYLNLQ
jgi:ligand-binding sensor domain-containing protein